MTPLLVIVLLIIVIAFLVLRPRGGPDTATAHAQSAATASAETEITYQWNGQTIRLNNHRSFGTYEYSTQSRRHYFRFEIKQVVNEIRIYILESPSYGNRRDDAHSTHRYFDASRGHYICIRDDLKPDNVPEALSWMIYWAEQTGKYIDTGRSFA